MYKGQTVPLSAMYGIYQGGSPWSSAELPFIQPSEIYKHDILCQNKNDQGPPPPAPGHDLWDHAHVKLPCSEKSVYFDRTWSGQTTQKSRWESIKSALKKKEIKDSKRLVKVIKKYNPTKNWTFPALKHFCDDIMQIHESDKFFKHTLPGIINLALQLPDLIKAPIPLLKKGKSRSLTLSQQQIACLLANAFLCTFPLRNTTNKNNEYANYPKINFANLYESKSPSSEHKLRCILNYFERVLKNMPTGVVTFTRTHVSTRFCPKWENSNIKLNSLILHLDHSLKIEEAAGLIQVDFANKFIGGGVLGDGCVQEEIRFVICPELMISMLFTEELGPNDALMIIGCERYSAYKGYGRDRFQFSHNYEDSTPRDRFNRKRNAVLAIDATVFHDEKSQYLRKNLLRELNKAWIGFSFIGEKEGTSYPGVATGNWGCGAFGGSAQLKSLLQLMAAAQARRPLLYLTFRDEQLKAQLMDIYATLAGHDVTVGYLYILLMKYYKKVNQGQDLFTFLKTKLAGQTDHSDDTDVEVGTEAALIDFTPPSSHQESNIDINLSSNDIVMDCTPRNDFVTTDYHLNTPLNTNNLLAAFVQSQHPLYPNASSHSAGCTSFQPNTTMQSQNQFYPNASHNTACYTGFQPNTGLQSQNQFYSNATNHAVGWTILQPNTCTQPIFPTSSMTYDYATRNTNTGNNFILYPNTNNMSQKCMQSKIPFYPNASIAYNHVTGFNNTGIPYGSLPNSNNVSVVRMQSQNQY